MDTHDLQFWERAYLIYLRGPVIASEAARLADAAFAERDSRKPYYTGQRPESARSGTANVAKAISAKIEIEAMSPVENGTK